MAKRLTLATWDLSCVEDMVAAGRGLDAESSLGLGLFSLG